MTRVSTTASFMPAWTRQRLDHLASWGRQVLLCWVCLWTCATGWAQETAEGAVAVQRREGPDAFASILKIRGSEIQQRITELALEAVGHYGAPYFRGFGEGDNEHPIGPDYAHRAAPTYFNMRKTSIYGGSNEIQRNIITKMILGL